jgi:predicted nucleic acid-binding protein
MSDKWLLDTNLLVYAYDSHDLRKQSIKNPILPEDAQKCIQLFGNLEVVEIDRLLVYQAIDLHRQHRISYWDALIVAAAERAGCSKVLSEDLNEGQRYNSIEIQNPFRP